MLAMIAAEPLRFKRKLTWLRTAADHGADAPNGGNSKQLIESALNVLWDSDSMLHKAFRAKPNDRFVGIEVSPV